MKMVFVVYSQAADDSVIAALKATGITVYTKVERACGEGTATEPKLHTHTWPGENCVLFMALEDGAIAPVTELIRRLQQEHPRAGIRGFVLPMEEIV